MAIQSRPMQETPTNKNATISKGVRGLMLGFSLHSWENMMVVSLALAGIVALLVGISTYCVVQLQRSENAESKSEFEKHRLETAIRVEELKADAAASNVRTKEAEFKLQQLRKLAGPRSLRHEVFFREIAGKPKAPVQIWYLPDSSDGWSFSSHLYMALMRAGWETTQMAPIPEPSTHDDGVSRVIPRAVAAGGQPSGITVVGDGRIGGKGTAFDGLVTAILKSTDLGVASSADSEYLPVSPGTLRVVIAAKPDPIFVPAEADLGDPAK